MQIEIHEPELEDLIRERLATGSFHDVEDVLLRALKAAPAPRCESPEAGTTGTGLDILSAMQAMPYKDEVDLELPRPHLPVRDAAF